MFPSDMREQSAEALPSSKRNTTRQLPEMRTLHQPAGGTDRIIPWMTEGRERRLP